MNVSEPQIINLLEPKDYQAGSQDMDSVNMGKLHRLKICVQLGAITGEDPVFKLYAGATAGAKTTEMAFKYRLSGADFAVASADVFGARTAIAAGGTGLTLNPVANYDHRVITIDVQSDEMPDGRPWLTVETDDGSASVLLMSALGVAWPREVGDTHKTAL
jgi:hypothetical protein